MRILQINTVCGIGSTGRIAVDLYNELQQEGHECLIAYGRGQAPIGINAFKFGNRFGQILHGVLTRIFDLHGFGSSCATKKLIKRVKQFSPDIIQLHNIHGYYINIKLLFQFLKEYNKPVVWTLHDCWAFTGHCSYFSYVKCNKWQESCHHCPQKRRYPSSLLFDASKHNYKLKKKYFTSLTNLTIITPSNWLKGVVERSFLQKYPIKVIHNGVDLTVFKPSPSNIREDLNLVDKKIILGVANIWEERKGFQYFIELADKLTDEYRIILVGLTKKQIKKLPNNIIGIEHTNSVQELAEFYTAADVFVNPTLEDNFPTTNLEAIACGTPVVTFDSGGSVETIVQNNLALSDVGIVKDINLDSLLQEIYKIICFFPKTDFKSFDKIKTSQKYLDYYKNLI